MAAVSTVLLVGTAAAVAGYGAACLKNGLNKPIKIEEAIATIVIVGAVFVGIPWLCCRTLFGRAKPSRSAFNFFPCY